MQWCDHHILWLLHKCSCFLVGYLKRFNLKRKKIDVYAIKMEYIERKPSAYPKIWKTLSKNRKIKFFFVLGQELVPPAHLKAQWSVFSEDLNQNKSKQMKMKINDIIYCFTSKAYFWKWRIFLNSYLFSCK